MKRKLSLYVEQDTAAVGIWTVDCPELFIIGAQASGRVGEAISEVLPAADPEELEIRDMTAAGAWSVEYDGE